MIFNGSILGRWGTTADICSGPQRLVHADLRLVQPMSVAFQDPCAALRMFKSDVGHPLPLGCVLCASSLKDSLQSSSYHKDVAKENEKHKQVFWRARETSKQAPLVVNEISGWLLNWALKGREYKFWYNSKRYSALSWDAMRFLGMSKLFSKTDSRPNCPQHFRI